MIYKTRRQPTKILGLQAFDNRLPFNHELKSALEGELAKTHAGYAGEQNFDKHLVEFNPLYAHAILHDVSLSYDQVFFQMDSVLITPAAIFIFEVKNISGKLILEDNPDRFTRQLRTGETKSMQSPIAQLERKKYFLEKWLQKKNIKIPIKCVVVFAFTNELQLATPSKYPIMFSYQIPNYLRSLSLSQGPLKDEAIQKLAYEMIANHHSYNPFPIVQKWSVSYEEIQRGVQCERCRYFSMRWFEKRWNCQKCGATSLTSHVRAISEWFYLMDDKMTNRQFRSFAKIDERHVVKRLLQNTVVDLIGEGRNSYYILKNEFYGF